MKIGRKTLWAQCERAFERYGLEDFQAAIEDMQRAVIAKGRKWRGA